MVEFELFSEWAEDHFDKIKVRRGRQEVMLPSPFETDSGTFDMDNTRYDGRLRLYCGMEAGGKTRADGVYHCFKSGRKGTLVGLVQLVAGCEEEEARATLEGRTPVYDLEALLDNVLGGGDDVPDPHTPRPAVGFPEGTYAIREIAAVGCNGHWRVKAEGYLSSRALPVDGLYVCLEGAYKGRIVIPYLDEGGKLVYWSARATWDCAAKYLGPPRERFAVGKDDVLYSTGLPARGEKLYVCEGEFDAMSLARAGLPAVAVGGKSLSERQALVLGEYHAVLALDGDDAGRAASVKFAETLRGFTRTGRVSSVGPPRGLKDWNAVLVEAGPNVLGAYVERHQHPVDLSMTSSLLWL